MVIYNNVAKYLTMYKMEDMNIKDKKCSCHDSCCKCKEKNNKVDDVSSVVDENSNTQYKDCSNNDKNPNLVSKDSYIRLLADFENYKKRTESEKKNTFLLGEKNVLTDFLVIVDDFERMIADKSIDSKTHEGVNLVYKKIMSFFAKFNVTKIEIKEGDKFDDTVAESVSTQDTDDEKKDDTIAIKYEDGYKINNIVMRYAKVVVNKYKKK